MTTATDAERLAEVFEIARGGDWPGALFRLKRLRDEGFPEAAFYVASIYETGGPNVEKDVAKALELYEGLVEEHDPWAIAALGRLHFVGSEVPRDYAKASRYYRILSEAGEARAQFVLGDMHMRGLGVERDEKLARELFELSADAGNVYAMRNVGLLDIRDGRLVGGIWKTLKAVATRILLKWSDRSSERLWRI